MIERQQSFDNGERSESGKKEGKLLQDLVCLTISNDLLCPCSGPDPGLIAFLRVRAIDLECKASGLRT